jgi:hypothetical protein
MTWAIWVTYGGATAERWGVAGMHPVGIVVALMTELYPIWIIKSALARPRGIIKVVVAIVVLICGRSAVAMVVISGWIVKTRIAVVVVPRGIKAMGWTGIAGIRRSGGESIVRGMVVCWPLISRR